LINCVEGISGTEDDATAAGNDVAPVSSACVVPTLAVRAVEAPVGVTWVADGDIVPDAVVLATDVLATGVLARSALLH